MVICIVGFNDNRPNSVFYRKFKGKDAPDNAAAFYKEMIKRPSVNVISTRKVAESAMLFLELKLLKKQINDLLNSNISEDSKTGLHHMLGHILDGIIDEKQVNIIGTNQ